MIDLARARSLAKDRENSKRMQAWYEWKGCPRKVRSGLWLLFSLFLKTNIAKNKFSFAHPPSWGISFPAHRHVWGLAFTTPKKAPRVGLEKGTFGQTRVGILLLKMPIFTNNKKNVTLCNPIQILQKVGKQEPNSVEFLYKYSIIEQISLFVLIWVLLKIEESAYV